jgi:hypothetical protein
VALSVSAPIRVVALLGLLLALIFGGAMKFMGGGGSDSVSSVVPSRNPAVVHARSVARQASARAKNPAAPTAAHKPKPTTATQTAPSRTQPASTTAPPTTTPAATTTTPAPVATQNRAAKQLSAGLTAGLPLPLARALVASPKVVVAIYNPNAPVDGIAFAEARAGAALAGAGFVGLNVLSEAQIGKLTEQLGLLSDPSVLVFTRPAKLAAKLEGFVDKETVAQAAYNAGRAS